VIINPGFRLYEFREEVWDNKYTLYRDRWAKYPLVGISSKMPLNLDIETTNNCNLKCPFCVREFMTDKVGNMSMTTFEKLMHDIVDEYGRSLVPAIKLNWRGEPTLHKDLPKFVEMAKKIGVTEVAINTNGTKLDSVLAARLIDAGLDRIIFSIDSIDPEIYKSQRVAAELGTTISNFKDLVKLRKIKDAGYGRPYIRVQKIDLPETRAESEAYVRYFKELGADAVAINTYKEKDGTIVDWEPLQCAQPFQRIGVTWEGNYFACCQGELFPYIGNVETMTVKEAWNSPFMHDLRKAHRLNRQKEIPQCCKCETTKPMVVLR
jgi:hypothetical protein